MKPKLFTPGQAITPVLNKPFTALTGELLFQPKPGEIYHCKNYCKNPYQGHWLIRLHECPTDNQVFIEDDFAPVISTNDLYKEINNIEQFVPADYVITR